MYRIVLVLIFVACLGACAQQGSVSDANDRYPLQVESRSRSYDDGNVLEYAVGTLEVPERRAASGTRNIAIQFHYFAALPGAPADVPPVYLLRGGPGFSGLEGNLNNPGYYGAYIAQYRALTDVVVLEHRGFGEKNATPCASRPPTTLAQVATPAARMARYRAAVFACRDAYLEQGVDLAGYTVVELAHDLVDVANALGHTDIQLLGNSFGSHWAMAIVRAYPDRIARVTLTALEGPDQTFDLPLERDAALRAIARDKPANWLDDFRALVATLDDAPVMVHFEDARAGEAQSIELTGQDLRGVVDGFRRGTTWGFLFPTWGEDMRMMLAGDFSGAARRLHYVWTRTEVESAAFFSFECGSGASKARAQALADQAGRALFRNNTLVEAGICADWPVDLGARFRAPFQTPVPAVLVHGTYDTATPFANAASVRASFTDHHFIEVRGGSHGALIEANDQVEGLSAALLRWVATGETQDLPERVRLAPIAW
ncbi:MAG: alpha/beta fold hydrolase [Pseudomonadota bacterium]